MMEELSGEDVKAAAAERLLEVFEGDAKVYKEAQSEPAFPHIFVHQVGFTDEEDRRGVHILDYSFDARYREASDPATVPDLQAKLDAAALKISGALNLLDFGERKVKCVEKSAEKEDGVLHFFFHVKVMAKEAEESPARKFGGRVEVAIGTR